MDSINSLEKQFDKMEMRKKTLFELIKPLTPEEYNWQPHPHHWSSGQAANHLYLSEKYSLAYLRKKMSYPDTIPPFHIKSWWGMFLYRTIMFSVIKAKAPKNINMWEGQDIMQADELEQKWNELRIEFFGFLREKFPEFNNRLVYNHPFAGRLSMRQMLIFFGDHILHHTRQVRRILELQKKSGM